MPDPLDPSAQVGASGEGSSAAGSPFPSTIEWSDEQFQRLLSTLPAGSAVTLLCIRLPEEPQPTSLADDSEESMQRWLSPKQVAARHDVQPATVRRWFSEGRFPGAKQLPNGAIRIPVKSADAVLANAVPNETADASQPPSRSPIAIDASSNAETDASSSTVTEGVAVSEGTERLGDWRRHLKVPRTGT